LALEIISPVKIIFLIEDVAGAILGMYCLASADVGGHTILTSSRTVHDEIQKIRPDLLEILYQPFYADRRGNEATGTPPYDLSPIFAMHGNELRCQYHQPFYNNAQKNSPNYHVLLRSKLKPWNYSIRFHYVKTLPLKQK